LPDNINEYTHPVAYKFFSLIEELRQEKQPNSFFQQIYNKNHTKGNIKAQTQTFSFKSCFNGVQELLTPDGGGFFSLILEVVVLFSFALKLFVLA